MNRKIHCLLALSFLLSAFKCFSQYILNGSAQKNSCNCYTLTQAVEFQSGSVWNGNKINLSNSFDFWFNVNLGCNDAGADGIVFILQPISTSVGTSGEGMGFGGVTPSIGIALDTYQNLNLNDPVFDHISIQANGNTNHNSDLAGPVAISANSNNVEDCAWHKLRITWNGSTKWLRTYFDGVLRVERQVDLVTSIFNNDPNVYWGFTGATGGEENVQQFCTALDPIFTTNFPNNTVCENAAINFSNTSESFAPIVSYNWSFGDGTFSTAQNPPAHVYNTPGKYTVNLKVIGQDGCERDSSKTITVASVPSAALTVFDTCFRQIPRLQFVDTGIEVKSSWQLDGGTGATNLPSLGSLSTGLHQLQLTVSSNYACGQPATIPVSFIINPLPLINANFDNACRNEIVQFDGEQIDNATSITQWNWLIGSTLNTGQSAQQSFTQSGDYNVQLWAAATNGCSSDTVEKIITINEAKIIARDTTIITNTPTPLFIQANGDVAWWPQTGLSNPTLINPVATLSADQKYSITVTTPEGCTAEDTMLVKVFKGPAIYVPTAFTPNGDGRNELLLPVYVGIKELKEFAVFNRWGQLVFRTNQQQKGWDGIGANAGTYVWLIRSVDSFGSPIILKGTVTVIK